MPRPFLPQYYQSTAVAPQCRQPMTSLAPQCHSVHSGTTMTTVRSTVRPTVTSVSPLRHHLTAHSDNAHSMVHSGTATTVPPQWHQTTTTVDTPQCRRISAHSTVLYCHGRVPTTIFKHTVTTLHHSISQYNHGGNSGITVSAGAITVTPQ